MKISLFATRLSSNTAVPKVWVNYPLVGNADFAVGNDLKIIILV